MSFQTATAVASSLVGEGMREEVSINVTLSYDCPAELSLTEQKARIESDIARMMDADTTTGVECQHYKIEDIQPEAQTYSGWKQTNNVPQVQANRMIDTLSDHYEMDADQVAALLEYALCDLRHLADERGLSFGKAHASSYQHYLSDRSV